MVDGNRARSFSKVKAQNMRATTDLKACLILELLGAGIPHGSVDYECGSGMHRFVVWCRGFKYELSFLESLLQACNAEDITNAVRIVIERIAAQTQRCYALCYLSRPVQACGYAGNVHGSCV
jgi:hypothetical protein